MKKQTARKAGRIGCLALAVVFALSAPSAAFASAASTKKDETVYVSLGSDGTAQSTVVSDWLHSESGSQQITDRSNLGNIQNVKTNEAAVRNGDMLSWVLSSDNTGKNIYYQGTTSKATPLSVSVAYTLDGKAVTANEIAGKTGKVSIRLTVKNNDRQTVSVRGKNVSMAVPMTAVVAATLPVDTFKNVTVSSGKVVTDGNNQFVVFCTMPGLSESLNLKGCGISELSSLSLPETLTVEADAVKFHLPSVAVAAVPKLLDSDKLASSDDLNSLVASLGKLKSIQNDLQNADPQKNLSSLITNPDRTAAARLLVDDVFDFYRLDTTALDLLPQYVNDSTFRLADRVTSDLNKADLKYLLESSTLTRAAGSLAKLDTAKAQALLNDYGTLSSLDTAQLAGAETLLGSYGKISGGLDKVLQDTGSLLNHTDSGALATLGVLGSPAVKSSLSGTLGSMNSLSGALAQYGVSSVQFSEADVQALLQSYLSRNLGTLAGNAAAKYSAGGSISVQSLSAMLTSFGVDKAAQAALLQQLGTALGTNLGPASVIPDGAVSALLTNDTVKTAVVSALSGTLAAKLTPSVNSLLKNSADLQASLTKALGSDYGGKLAKAADSLSGSASSLAALQKDLGSLTTDHKSDLESCKAEAAALLSDTASLNRLLAAAGKLGKMKGDLDANRGNIAVLTDLMKTASDPKVKAAAAELPALRTDAANLNSAVSPLLKASQSSSAQAGLGSLSQTAKTLLKIEKDVNQNRSLMNLFRQATEPSTISTLRGALGTLDSLQSGTSSGLASKLDGIEDLLARKDAYVALADKNSIFTEAADGASTEVKYIYKTPEIKVPEVKAAAVPTSASKQQASGGGFFQWLSSVFRRLGWFR